MCVCERERERERVTMAGCTMCLQITIPQAQRRDTEKMYNRMTVRQLQERVPGVRCLTASTVAGGEGWGGSCHPLLLSLTN